MIRKEIKVYLGLLDHADFNGGLKNKFSAQEFLTIALLINFYCFKKPFKQKRKKEKRECMRNTQSVQKVFYNTKCNKIHTLLFKLSINNILTL